MSSMKCKTDDACPFDAENDKDNDGIIRKKELRRALVQLGYEAPAVAVSALFDTFDRDHGGTIEYAELHRAIRREAEAEAAAEDEAASVAVDAASPLCP